MPIFEEMKKIELEIINMQRKLTRIEKEKKLLENMNRKLKNKTVENKKYIYSLFKLMDINPEDFCSSAEVYHFLKNLN